MKKFIKYPKQARISHSESAAILSSTEGLTAYDVRDAVNTYLSSLYYRIPEVRVTEGTKEFIAKFSIPQREKPFMPSTPAFKKALKESLHISELSVSRWSHPYLTSGDIEFDIRIPYIQI